MSLSHINGLSAVQNSHRHALLYSVTQSDYHSGGVIGCREQDVRSRYRGGGQGEPNWVEWPCPDSSSFKYPTRDSYHQGMNRRECLMATVTVCSVSLTGCSALVADEEHPEDADDERPGITEPQPEPQPQRGTAVDEILAVEQSTAEEIASTAASARNDIVDIQDETQDDINRFEELGRNWITGVDSGDGVTLAYVVEDFIDNIEREARDGQNRIRKVKRENQATVEQLQRDGQDEIEGIPATMFGNEPDEQTATAVRTAVGTLDSSAQDASQTIETTVQDAITEIDETARESIERLETAFEER